LAACLILIVTVFTLYYLNRSLIIRPLTRLREKIRQFEEDVNTPVHPSARRDEIGALENGFYQMPRTIQNSHKEMRREILRATEEQRRLNSELKKANLQLQQRDELKTNFLATVSHELRTPLTTIKGGVDYLMKTVEEKEQKRFLEILERNIRQLIRMVNNLIDLARIELDRIELEPEEVNLKELLDEVILLFGGFIRERGVTIRREGFDDIIIPLDYRRMNQVFLNLLHNAVKFSPPGEEIIVKMETDATCFAFIRINVYILTRKNSACSCPMWTK
jgi:signal transduction histidine kinase